MLLQLPKQLTHTQYNKLVYSSLYIASSTLFGIHAWYIRALVLADLCSQKNSYRERRLRNYVSEKCYRRVNRDYDIFEKCLKVIYLLIIMSL